MGKEKTAKTAAKKTIKLEEEEFKPSLFIFIKF
jgi:hypothetical protein